MKTVFIGICEVNNRQYFCGLWPTLDHMKQQLAGAFTIEQAQPGPYDTIKHAIAVYGAHDTGIDRNSMPPEFPGFLGSEADGFSIYEVSIDDLPGYLPFDED